MKHPYFINRDICSVCGNKNFTMHYSISYNNPILVKYLTDFYNPQGGVEFKYLKDAQYTLLECSDCQLIFQENVLNEFLMFKLYEQWLDPKIALMENNEQSIEYFQRYALEIINLISFFDNKPCNLDFLDFGMGWGRWSLLVKAFGCNSFGSELSNDRINYAKKNGIEILDWENISKRKFDFINTEQVFEHIPKPLETLKYLAKSLKPDGIIKISVPDGTFAKRTLSIMDWNIPKGAQDSLNIVAPLEHINCFRTETIITMANKCGLEYFKMNLKYSITDLTKIKEPTFKDALKNVLRPYYHKYLKRPKKKPEYNGTYLFFRKPIK